MAKGHSSLQPDSDQTDQTGWMPGADPRHRCVQVLIHTNTVVQLRIRWRRTQRLTMVC